MNVRSKNGHILSVRLYKQELGILESAQGLCRMIAKTLAGERVGEEAEAAEKSITSLRAILTAVEPAKLEPKEPLFTKEKK